MILEELGLNYRAIRLDTGKGEQRSPEHLKNNPNGRLPTLIDHKNADFAVWCAYMLPLLPIWLSDAILLPQGVGRDYHLPRRQVRPGARALVRVLGGADVPAPVDVLPLVGPGVHLSPLPLPRFYPDASSHSVRTLARRCTL